MSEPAQPKPDAICGNCGSRRALHDGDECIYDPYCFSTNPRAAILGEWIRTKPDLHAQLVQQWRKENGHE